MNDASQWRIEFAREIAGWYASQPHVRMIALGGSAARGLADAYSDMDMAVYWEELDRAWLAEPPLKAAARVQAILTIDRQQAVAALSELIAEVLDLVEQHMPEIDTSRTRMIQRMPARPCTAKPNLLAADDKQY